MEVLKDLWEALYGLLNMFFSPFIEKWPVILIIILIIVFIIWILKRIYKRPR